jgi:hypothetical protein
MTKAVQYLPGAYQADMPTASATKRQSETLVGVEPLIEIVETSLCSAHLKDAIPISLMLIGPSGAGKSKLLNQYKLFPGCHLTTDVTSIGLQELLARDVDGKIRFLLIPDFNLVLSHRASTLSLTIANLLSATSEGIVRIDDGREKKETKHSPIGIISAMTRDLYIAVAKKWHVLGFTRRCLPIFYDYGIKTRKLIQESIANGKVTFRQLEERELKVKGAKFPISIGNFAGELERLSNELAEHNGWLPTMRNKKGRRHNANESNHAEEASGQKSHAYYIGKQLEFSPHLALRSMAAAHAIREQRENVTASDIDFVERLLSFTRYDRPGEL